jgi:hypothetical protein
MGMRGQKVDNTTHVADELLLRLCIRNCFKVGRFPLLALLGAGTGSAEAAPHPQQQQP